MTGFIIGKVLFSDGQEAIVLTPSGVGFQIHFPSILPEGEQCQLFISHVIRETSEVLFGFKSLREKKLFELLITVKGVGPKSAFALMSAMTSEEIIQAIILDNKKILTNAPGIGTKAASQIILDLQKKAHKIRIFDRTGPSIFEIQPTQFKAIPSAEDSPPTSGKAAKKSDDKSSQEKLPPSPPPVNLERIFHDTLSACRNLGFKDDQIIPLAQKLLSENSIVKVEQLVHLVLKEA